MAFLSPYRRSPACYCRSAAAGVGKTDTAVALAELIYGGEQNMTTINMSEFKEEHKVSLLLGSRLRGLW
jgi:type VI secretion system protein VasG